MPKSNEFYVRFDSDTERFTNIAKISEKLRMWRIAQGYTKAMNFTYALIQAHDDVSQILQNYLKIWDQWCPKVMHFTYTLIQT